MLRIVIPADEWWDEQKEEFVRTGKEQVLQLEHSLISLSKWESKWHKPFLSKTPLTDEETIDYIRCMTLTQNVNSEVYDRLTTDNLRQIEEYINNPMTATTFSVAPSGKKPNREIITAEVIYYWMTTQNIPWECQKWHLNRLITLIRVCTIKNSPPTKRNKRDIMAQNAAINAARKKQLNTRG